MVWGSTDSSGPTAPQCHPDSKAGRWVPVQGMSAGTDELTQTDTAEVSHVRGMTQQKTLRMAPSEQPNGQNLSFGESHHQIPSTEAS